MVPKRGMLLLQAFLVVGILSNLVTTSENGEVQLPDHFVEKLQKAADLLKKHEVHEKVQRVIIKYVRMFIDIGEMTMRTPSGKITVPMNPEVKDNLFTMAMNTIFIEQMRNAIHEKEYLPNFYNPVEVFQFIRNNTIVLPQIVTHSNNSFTRFKDIENPQKLAFFHQIKSSPEMMQLEDLIFVMDYIEEILEKGEYTREELTNGHLHDNFRILSAADCLEMADRLKLRNISYAAMFYEAALLKYPEETVKSVHALPLLQKVTSFYQEVGCPCRKRLQKLKVQLRKKTAQVEKEEEEKRLQRKKEEEDRRRQIKEKERKKREKQRLKEEKKKKREQQKLEEARKNETNQVNKTNTDNVEDGTGKITQKIIIGKDGKVKLGKSGKAEEVDKTNKGNVEKDGGDDIVEINAEEVEAEEDDDEEDEDDEYSEKVKSYTQRVIQENKEMYGKPMENHQETKKTDDNINEAKAEVKQTDGDKKTDEGISVKKNPEGAETNNDKNTEKVKSVNRKVDKKKMTEEELLKIKEERRKNETPDSKAAKEEMIRKEIEEDRKREQEIEDKIAIPTVTKEELEQLSIEEMGVCEGENKALGDDDKCIDWIVSRSKQKEDKIKVIKVQKEHVLHSEL